LAIDQSRDADLDLNSESKPSQKTLSLALLDLS